MITYEKKVFGLNLLFRVHGSAVYRACFPAFLCVCCFLLFELDRFKPYLRSMSGDEGEQTLLHPYAVGVLISSTTFLIVFRANQGYSRYWEAASATHHMMSKWMDSAQHTAVFHMQSEHYNHIKPPSYFDHPDLDRQFLTRARERERTKTSESPSGTTGEKVSNDKKKGSTLDNSFVRDRALRKSISIVDMKSASSRSVLKSSGKSNASKMGRLGKEVADINDITAKNGKRPMARTYGFSQNADIGTSDYHHTDSSSPRTLQGYARLDGNWSQLFNDGKATYFNPDDPDMFNAEELPSFASCQGGRTPSLFLQELAHLVSLTCAVALATLRNDIDGSMSPLGLYEPGSPWPEVDSDDIENFTTSHGPWYKRVWLRLMYLLGAAKSPEERTRYNAARPLPVLGGVSDNEILFLQMARGPLAKTQLCWNWLSEFIIREHLAGSLGKVGPPIVSRIIQFLSDGMIYYNHARKIMFIPFPFPHAQLSSLFVNISIPVIAYLMTEYADSILLGILLCFFSTLCLSGIHEVARELENPFRNIPNELPLVTFQAQFNEALITMFAGYHPDFFWDPDRYTNPPTPLTTASDADLDDIHEEISEAFESSPEQKLRKQGTIDESVEEKKMDPLEDPTKIEKS